MYRKFELSLFTALSTAGDLFLLAALFLVGCYYFYSMEAVYRHLALILVVFSVFFKTQVFMYKVIILEKRMLHLTGPSLQHFEVASRAGIPHLIIYCVLIWLALIGLIISTILS